MKWADERYPWPTTTTITKNERINERLNETRSPFPYANCIFPSRCDGKQKSDALSHSMSILTYFGSATFMQFRGHAEIFTSSRFTKNTLWTKLLFGQQLCSFVSHLLILFTADDIFALCTMCLNTIFFLVRRTFEIRTLLISEKKAFVHWFTQRPPIRRCVHIC